MIAVKDFSREDADPERANKFLKDFEETYLEKRRNTEASTETASNEQ